MSEADLLALKGQPESKSVLGSKAIYRWPDMQVNLENGKVARITVRNPSEEKVNEERRKKMNEELAEKRRAQQLQEEEEQRRQLAAAEAARERAAVDKMRRDISDAASLQRKQIELEKQRLRQEKIEKDKENLYRKDSLRAEIASARQEAALAAKVGDSRTYQSKMRIVEAKQRELNELSK